MEKNGKNNHKKKKILFIEDEPDQITMVRMRLGKAGYDVSAAEDGTSGLEKAVRERPDLIMLDVVIPGLDGFEVCRRLKKDPRTKDIPIIVATADGSDDIEQLCLLAGAAECLRKPYDSEDLLQRIRVLMGE